MDQTESYKVFAKALRDYFSPHPWENEVLLLLLLPTIFILIWLFFSMRPSSKQTAVPASKRDLEFFEIARLQKGLESFDRDLLVDLAERADIRPVYRILLERRLYEKALRKAEEDTVQGLPGATDRKTIEYLRRLQKRIFKPLV